MFLSIHYHNIKHLVILSCYKYRCVSGYKQRQLPDGTLTCEASGERAVLLLAEGGELRAWQPRALRQHDDLAGTTELGNR